MKIIGFCENTISERGTTASIFDYAYHNENMLGNKSIIIYDKNSPGHKREIIENFKLHFTVIPSDSYKDIDEIVKENKITHVYQQVTGFIKDSVSVKNVKNCIHSVFVCHEPHGDCFASISKWVPGYNTDINVVPLIVDLPSHDRNMRSKLGIPERATVFGGYGGKENFNMRGIKDSICDIAKKSKDIYFIFANFEKFGDDIPNIIHIDTLYGKDEKVEFINTCDAMVWARYVGETFGLSIAEFSSKNKPVLMTNSPYANAHIHLLGAKGIHHKNRKEFEKNVYIIHTNLAEIKKMDWNAYRDYEPEKVMKIFDEVFLNDDERLYKTKYN